MKKEKWISGAKVLKQDLDQAQDGPEQAILDRQVDNFAPGVAADLLNGMDFIAGATTTSITVRTGVAYTSVGERIYISNETVQFNPANPSTTTPDGLGGNTLTPLSTGSADITMSSGAVNLVYVQYLEAVDPSEFTLHKVTGQKLFTDVEDGYEIRVVNVGSVTPTTVDLVSSAPGDGGPWTFLGWVDFRGGGSISTSMFNTLSRTRYKLIPDRSLAVTPKPDLSNRTPDGNYGASTEVTLDQHVKAVGSTVPTATNPHGLTVQDIGFTGKTVEIHEKYLHSSGIVNGVLGAGAGDSLNLQINPRCPDVDDVIVYGLSSTQFVNINGTTLDTSDLFGTLGTKTFSFDTSLVGTYYLWVDVSTRTVEIGTSAPSLAAGKFLLWTINFNPTKGSTNIESGHFIVPPGGPCAGTSNFTNLVDGRLFGNLGSDNVQTDGSTDTFTLTHSQHITQNLTLDGGLRAAVIANSIKQVLVVKSNVTNPNYQVNITADLLSVQGVLVPSVSLTTSITSSGANGLDTGSEASSTWYAIHVITNATGSLVAGLLSVSASAPTLPTGYTKFRRVGWVRNNGSSNFVAFERIGDQIYYNFAARPVNFTGPNDAAPHTDVRDLTPYVPAGSRVALLNAHGTQMEELKFTLTDTGTYSSEFNVANPNINGAIVLWVRIDVNQSVTTYYFRSDDFELGVLGYVDLV